MLFNFCDPCLRPEVECNTISTEGYEVTNLINSSKGFLAYSCIRPPIEIDFTFICNIAIQYVLIWPSVGSQRSTGFQLFGKPNNDQNTPFSLLSFGSLGSSNSGLLFHSPEIDSNNVTIPPNFMKCQINKSKEHITRYVNSLRIRICKTENSVPALGRIEVWGMVSPRCGKDVVASVFTLWSTKQILTSLPLPKESIALETDVNQQDIKSSLEVPECFLDAITWEIMTQPITLPSGKIIDKITLEKHEKNEALWGRKLTDPFTGLTFSENRKPLLAVALKARIDKFLLENGNNEEIKKIPRVLGRHLNATSSLEVLKPTVQQKIIDPPKTNPCASHPEINSNKRKMHCHRLPVIAIHSQTTKIRKVPILNLTNSQGVSKLLIPEEKQAKNTQPNCDCCIDKIFYQLPCKTIVCRKTLTSQFKHKCDSCGVVHKSSEIERIFQ